MKGRIISINISERKGTIKKPINEAIFQKDHGIEGDAHAGKTHRQVSLLGNESIDKMRKTGIKGLCSGKFAENLTTEGIVLYDLPIGTRLKIGNSVHEITQIGKECHNDCAIKLETGDCVMPREGIFTRVVEGGKAKVGDTIEIIHQN